MVAAKASDDFSRYTTRRIGTGRERVRSVACEFAAQQLYGNDSAQVPARLVELIAGSLLCR